MSVVLKELFSYRNKIKEIAICSNKEDLTKEIRTEMYNLLYEANFIKLLYDDYDRCFVAETPKHFSIFYNTYSYFLDKIKSYRIDVIKNTLSMKNPNLRTFIQDVFFKTSYNEFLDFFEIFLNYFSEENYSRFDLMQKIINSILEKYSYPLRVINGQFIDITNPQQIETIQNAFHITQEKRFTATYNHLDSAITKLKIQHYKESICDSIHAIEAIAKQISGVDNKSLSIFLSEIKKSKIVNTHFHKACEELYKFCSETMRHAGNPNSDPLQEDAETARFMLGVCSSFVSYLIEKSDTLREIYKN